MTRGGRATAGDPDFPATLAAAAGGDPQALEWIYRTYGARVAGYLRSQGVADVGGTTNDVFLRVFRGLPGFAGDEPKFCSWVFTIAHHLMVDERRRAGRRPSIADGASLERPDPGGDAEEMAMVSLGQARVHGLLSRLSTDQRAVVLLRIVEDQSIEQVAEALGKAPTAVKALQHRALTALRRHLVDEEVSP